MKKFFMGLRSVLTWFMLLTFPILILEFLSISFQLLFIFSFKGYPN